MKYAILVANSFYYPELCRRISIVVQRSAIFGSLLAALVMPWTAQATVAPGRVVAWGWDAYGQTDVVASATNAIAVACGDYTTLALLADGTVIGWGGNFGNALNLPTGLTNVIAIAGAYEDSAALLGNGTVVAWGYDGDGETNVPAGVTNAVAIAGGGYRFLALLANGTVVGWGTNDQGQITVPASVTNAVAISAGNTHSLALLANGKVVAWGDNSFGETNVPPSVTNAVAIAAGFDFSVALLTNGNVVAWGYSASGETNAPANVTNAVAIASGPDAQHILAELADGTVVAWGYDLRGETNVPVNVISPDGLAAGAYHSVAVLPPLPPTISCPFASDPSCSPTNVSPLNVTVHVHDTRGNPLEVVWYVNGSGYQTNDLSASGGGATDTNLALQAETGDFGPFDISASVSDGLTGAVSCVTIVNATSPGNVAAWGQDSSNQIDVPAAVTNAIVIAGGDSHSLALLPNGKVVAWGNDSNGETNVPTSVTNAVAIAAGFNVSAAVLANGRVVAWGYGGNGVTNVPASVTNAIAVSAGVQNMLALLANGTVIVWGPNDVGLNETNVPPSVTNAVAAAMGGYHSIALLMDGTVVGWGRDGNGETDVPASVTNAVAIAAGGYHNLALLANGMVTAWGDNTYGQTNVPANVTNAVAIAAGNGSSLALLTDGEVVAWGNDTYGETNVPAGLTDAIAIAAGDYHSLAIHALHISLVGPSSTNVLCHATYTDPGFTAMGTCGLDLGATTNSDLDTTVPGHHTITYTAALGEWSRSVSRDVLVMDPNTPVPNANPLPQLTGQCSVSVTNPPTAGDACDPAIVGTTSDPTNYTSQGTNIIHWTYNNWSGTIITQLQTVVVADTDAPIVFCPSDIVVDATNGASTVVTFPLPTAFDNCTTNPGVICVPASGSTFGVGTNSVAVTATDGVGNQSVCHFNVFVRGPLQQDGYAFGEIYGLLGDALSALDSKKLVQVSKTLTNAVLSTDWHDVEHPTTKGAKAVFGDDSKTAQGLLAFLKTKGNTLGTNTLNGIVSELVQSARNTALIAISDAQNANGNATLIAAANVLMAKGDAALTTGKPQTAIKDYASAWQTAVKALH